MAGRRKKTEELLEVKLNDKASDKASDKAKAPKVNAGDAAAKVRLSTIVQLLEDENDGDRHLQVALKHIKDMLSILETSKAVRGGVANTAVIKAKRDMVIDILEQCEQNRNVSIAISSLKQL